MTVLTRPEWFTGGDTTSGQGWDIGGVHYTKNPRRLVTRELRTIIELWQVFRGGGFGPGLMPDPGGYADQGAVLMDAFAICAAQYRDIQPEGHEVLGAAFQMAIRGDLKKYELGVATANTQAIRRVTNTFKMAGRRQIERAGLGKKLANALRGNVFSEGGKDITKRGSDPNPTGIVKSNAIVKGRKAGTFDLLAIFERGVSIRGTPYLAIGTREAGGRKAKAPSAYPPGTFRFVPLKKSRGRPSANRAVAVLIHKARKELWYVLLPGVVLKKRLKLDAAYQRAVASIPGALDAAYGRLFKRLEIAA